MATEELLVQPALNPHTANAAGSPRLGKESALPGHLVRLPGTDWAMWRWIVLRGAGFPAGEVLKLAAPECADAADVMFEAEAELEDQREQLLEAIRAQLSPHAGERDANLVKALRRLKNGKLPPAFVNNSELEALRTAMIQSSAELEAKRADFRASFEHASGEVSRAILDIARDDRFREAILWQNRSVVHSSLDALLRMPADLTAYGSARKQREALTANYLQRYCLKNDTIGFFGPVGWAEFGTEGEAMTAIPGAELLARRRVYFEVWGMDALAEMFTADERFPRWIVPRPMSFTWLEGSILHAWPKEPIHLSEAQVQLFNSCDGQSTAKEIARQLLGENTAAFRDEAQVYDGLRELQALGVVSWKFEAPLSPYPERALRQQLARIGDPELRAEAENKLDQLEAARTLVAAAAGNAQRLDEAISNLEETFTSITGAEATRAAGRTYAGRTLVYEDCRRDAEIKLGPAAVKDLGEPLSLLLQSAKWLTYAVAEAYRRAFTTLFEKLTRESRADEVEFNQFWSASRGMLFDEKQSLVKPIAAEFQQRWATLLNLPQDERRVDYSSATLRRHVEAAFFAPRSGWLSARYHNPDVMIAATDAGAVRRGDYVFVMGELHVAANAIGVPLFMEQHESPEEFFKAYDSDMPEPRLMPLVPKYWPSITSRLMLSLVTPRDYRLEMVAGPYNAPPARVLKSGQLVVRRTNEQLVVCTRDGRVSFDVVEAFANVLAGEVANHFKPLPPAEHTPRVSFDRLVVCRETWRFPASDIWFAFEKEPVDRFAEARRWTIAHELPRFVFVKAAVEMKPFYVDLASPVYVESLAKVIRRCVDQGLGEDTVVVSEMLPGPGESWLPDANGERYSSELRMVALDLKDSYV